MSNSALILAGAAIGLSVAAPIGPMGLLCINRTLARGVSTGISTGAGASTVQAGYGAVVLSGMHQVGPTLTKYSSTLSLLAAGTMLFFGIRLLMDRRAADSTPGAGSPSLLLAFGSAAAFNLINPMMLVLLTGSLAAVMGAGFPEGAQTLFVLTGLFAGSIFWWICLSFATAIARRRLDDRILVTVNRASAAAMIGFGLLAAARVAVS
jgi:threonine/homoserine/homoserine lactone efflux protein